MKESIHNFMILAQHKLHTAAKLVGK